MPVIPAIQEAESGDLLEANGAIFTVQGKAINDNAARGRRVQRCR